MALVHFVKLVLLVGSVKSMWAAFLLHFIHRICHERAFSPARETTQIPEIFAVLTKKPLNPGPAVTWLESRRGSSGLEFSGAEQWLDPGRVWLDGKVFLPGKK